MTGRPTPPDARTRPRVYQRAPGTTKPVGSSTPVQDRRGGEETQARNLGSQSRTGRLCLLPFAFPSYILYGHRSRAISYGNVESKFCHPTRHFLLWRSSIKSGWRAVCTAAARSRLARQQGLVVERGPSSWPDRPSSPVGRRSWSWSRSGGKSSKTGGAGEGQGGPGARGVEGGHRRRVGRCEGRDSWDQPSRTAGPPPHLSDARCPVQNLFQSSRVDRPAGSVSTHGRGKPTDDRIDRAPTSHVRGSTLAAILVLLAAVSVGPTVPTAASPRPDPRPQPTGLIVAGRPSTTRQTSTTDRPAGARPVQAECSRTAPARGLDQPSMTTAPDWVWRNDRPGAGQPRPRRVDQPSHDVRAGLETA